MPARVTEIWRYPVKSMLGESLTSCTIGPDGVVGDRAYALVDREDGKVASAKNPRKWERLLACQAAFVDDDTVEITLPDGATVRTDDSDVDAIVSAAVGRDVRVASTAPEDRVFEEVWPDIDGLAPDALIAGTTIGTDEDGRPISQLPLGSAAPAGTFFDLSVIHLLTTATLTHLQSLAPSSRFDPRRYRPNVVIDTDEIGFVENGWVGRTVRVGDAARFSVTLPTMRCVMTTLAQGDLPPDRETLRTIAASNRVEIPGWGTWACAGAYADVEAPGEIAVGDPATVLS